MAGVERAAKGPPTADPFTASATWRGLVATIVCALVLVCPAVGSRADAGARAPADPLEPPAPAPSSLEPAKLGPAAEERAVVPPPVLPPPPSAPAEEPASETAASRPLSLDAAKAFAASLVPAQRAALALALLKRSLRAIDPTKLATSKLASSAARSPRRPPDTAPDVGAAGPETPPGRTAASATTNGPPAGPGKAEPGPLDVEALDHIRLEIRSRLPYFQACADASRRRGGPEIRRLQAIWTIGADGAIRELRVENVDDAQLVVCITRMGSRPFAVKPGTDLTIPTPIVFVR